jgi:hypothetical protein
MTSRASASVAPAPMTAQSRPPNSGVIREHSRSPQERGVEAACTELQCPLPCDSMLGRHSASLLVATATLATVCGGHHTIGRTPSGAPYKTVFEHLPQEPSETLVRAEMGEPSRVRKQHTPWGTNDECWYYEGIRTFAFCWNGAAWDGSMTFG